MWQSVSAASLLPRHVQRARAPARAGFAPRTTHPYDLGSRRWLPNFRAIRPPHGKASAIGVSRWRSPAHRKRDVLRTSLIRQRTSAPVAAAFLRFQAAVAALTQAP